MGWLFKTKKKTSLNPSAPKPSRSPSASAEEVAVVVSRQISIAEQHHQAGRLAEAEAACRELLAADPGNNDILHLSGIIAYQLRKYEQAAELISEALSRDASNALAQLNLGNVFLAQGRLDEAIACYRRALALQPEFPEAQYKLGNALKDQGEQDGAIACYRRALALKPDVPEVYVNFGNVLNDQGKPHDAIACYQRAIRLSPGFPDAHANLGNAFQYLGELDKAIACYQKAIALDPDYLEAHHNLGNAFDTEDRLDEALACFRKALSISPGYVEARWALTMSQIPKVYTTVAEPLRCRNEFSRELDELERWFDPVRVKEGFRAVGVQQPFCLAYQEENNRDLLGRAGSLCTRLMSEWFDQQSFAPSGERNQSGAIRVGIVSQYFWNHSVWNAIVKGWFEQLDRRRFALHAFYLGSQQDQETLVAKSCATHFEQGGRGLRQWVAAILDQHPDVLLYPEVGMDPMTARLASLRLAPVQAATWGHPETTGLPTIDYYLSAEELEPARAQENYTERLVTLPHLGCFCQPSSVPVAHPELGNLGVEPESPLLLCPGVPFKYAPQYDSVLIEIARRLGRCRFVFFIYRLSSLSEKLRRRLEAVFARNRLEFDDFVSFVPWQNRSGFYGLLRRADLLLDTIGFSGFNTAMQAVECGLPIVTREGRFLRGRLASGILKRMGLSELVAQTEDDYVALAVRLVQDVEYREHLRERIQASRHVLFEDAAPIRALEEFLVAAAARR